jgi:hypothetical protein
MILSIDRLKHTAGKETAKFSKNGFCCFGGILKHHTKPFYLSINYCETTY